MPHIHTYFSSGYLTVGGPSRHSSISLFRSFRLILVVGVLLICKFLKCLECLLILMYIVITAKPIWYQNLELKQPLSVRSLMEKECCRLWILFLISQLPIVVQPFLDYNPKFYRWDQELIQKQRYVDSRLFFVLICNRQCPNECKNQDWMMCKQFVSPFIGYGN